MAISILEQSQIDNKIKRIAYQIYECNVDEKQIYLAGIVKNGFELAKRLQMEVEKISDIQVFLCEVNINKKDPLQEIKTSLPLKDFKNQSLVLVDDVLNSGATLIYSVKYFLDVPLKQFKTAVLVDRSHKKFPVKADFKGISLSTSLNEMVQVNFSTTGDTVELI